MEEKKINIREDLNDCVREIGFKTEKTSFGKRVFCRVTFFNNEVVDFKDSDGIFDLFQSYQKIGETDFIKSKELVEEQKKDEEGLFVCVKYTLKDGSEYRLFPIKFAHTKIIDNYYKDYKNKKKVEKPKQ